MMLLMVIGKKAQIQIFCFTLVLILMSCGQSQKTSGAGGQTGNALANVQTLIQIEGVYQSGIHLEARRAGSLDTMALIRGTTNSNGEFRFELETGSYTLEIRYYGDDGEVLSRFIHFEVEDTDKNIIEESLTQSDTPAQLFGSLSPDIIAEYPGSQVCLISSSYCTAIDSSGLYQFKGIPAGEHQIVVVHQGIVVVESEDLLLLPGTNQSKPIGLQLVFEDEFLGSVLDPTFWRTAFGDGCPEHCGWGNGSVQSFDTTHDVLAIQDGSLRIKAIREIDVLNNISYRSARVNSQRGLDWRYGRFEIRAKVSNAEGAWTIFSLQGADTSSVVWPERGSMDLASIQGSKADTAMAIVHQVVDSVYHFDIAKLKMPAPLSEDYHDYALDWDSQWMVFSVDGIETLRLAVSDVFQKNFFFQLELAVGGTTHILPPESDPFNAEVLIDRIRVYQRP
jgi:hypothetical protein